MGRSSRRRCDVSPSATDLRRRVSLTRLQHSCGIKIRIPEPERSGAVTLAPAKGAEKSSEIALAESTSPGNLTLFHSLYSQSDD